MRLEWIVDRRGEAGPVIDQGRRPTCLSCATSSAHHELSGEPRCIEFLHHASRSRPSGVGQFESVGDVLSAEGQPPEAQWPDDPTIDDSQSAPPAHISGPFAHATFEVQTPVDNDRLVSELEGGELPVIGLVTTRRFMVLQNQVLTEPDTHLNRHAVLLVGAATYHGVQAAGLQTGDRLMCIQNSWGATWGTSGFGLIAPRAWDDMVLVSAFLRRP